MPVYNGERFLREALDSWLAQEFGDFELIVSDNASTDATPDILAEYARKDRRIRVVRRPETVVASKNFNSLVPEAKGELFAWGAADDLRHPAFLRRLIEVLDSRPDAVLAYSRTRFFGDARREHRHRAPVRPPGDEPTPVRRIRALLRAREWVLMYGLIRLEKLRQTRLIVWPLGIDQDAGFVIELATLGPLVGIPDELSYYRMHEANVGTTPDDPIHMGFRGRRLDADGRAFIEGLKLSRGERRLVLREVAVWCRRSQKPRRFLWRSSGFRSLYTRSMRAWIDLSVAAHGY